MGYEYIISSSADDNVYKKQCIALEKHIPNLKKIRELHDVDDSKIMIYEKDNYKILVKNSYYIDVLKVESEIELEQFFN